MSSTVRKAILKLHERTTNRHILERLDALNATQWLSRDELYALQHEKLIRLVEYAAENVPYYRKLFAQVGLHSQDVRKDPEAIKCLPVLNKTLIRENWDDLQTIEPERKRQMSKLATSGSTGQPLVFMQDSDYRDYVTADIQRHIGWAGCGLGEPHAMIWGAPQNPTFSKRARLFLIDHMWNRFQMDAFTLIDESMQAFADKILKRKPKVLFGYATSLYQFAQYSAQKNFNFTFHGVFSTSELLLPPVRKFIEETFRCKVFDRYASLELGGIACECAAHTGLHISMENNIVEIIRDGSPVQPGQVGDFVVTNLNNLGMPFIRYSIGDAGTWYAGGKCPCGRDSLMLEMIEGRLVDSFATRTGTSVWSGFAGAGFRCLTHPSIKQFQVIQKTLDRMVLRLVISDEFPQSHKEEISRAFKLAYGENVTVDFEFPDEILPLPSGKHQYAISEVNQQRIAASQVSQVQK